MWLESLSLSVVQWLMVECEQYDQRMNISNRDMPRSVLAPLNPTVLGRHPTNTCIRTHLTVTFISATFVAFAFRYSNRIYSPFEFIMVRCACTINVKVQNRTFHFTTSFVTNHCVDVRFYMSVDYYLNVNQQSGVSQCSIGIQI